MTTNNVFKYTGYKLKITKYSKTSLQKHDYSNVLKILQPKKENFQTEISDIFHIPAQNIRYGSLEPPRRFMYPQFIFCVPTIYVL